MQKNVNNGQNGAATSAVKYNVVVKNNSIVFDVLDDAIDYVVMMIKDHPRDAIYVNGMGVRLEFGLDSKWSVVGRDTNMKMIAGFVMGKIKRGLRDAVEDVIKRGIEKMMEQEDNTIDVTEEDVINEVVEVINANLIDDATEGQKLDWTLFSDSTMEYLFANGGPELYEKIKNGVKSRRIVEVLAYDDCFYVWYDEEPVKNDAPCLDDDMELALERLADDIANRADSTMGDYFVDVTHNMWNANDAIDEDRLRELLFDKLDGVAEIDFAEPDDKAIVRIWFNRPIKKDAPCLDEDVDSGFGDDYFVKNDAPTSEKIEKILIMNKYNVIAHCADGDVIIGKDGVNDVTLDVAKEIAHAHMNMGVELSIVKL